MNFKFEIIFLNHLKTETSSKNNFKNFKKLFNNFKNIGPGVMGEYIDAVIGIMEILVQHKEMLKDFSTPVRLIKYVKKNILTFINFLF